MKVAAVAFGCLLAFWASNFLGQYVGFERGYEKGFESGKAEAQTPAYIVETCSAWWWGSNKEATKMLKKYCEVKK